MTRKRDDERERSEYGEMTLVDHLVELRNRLLRALAGVLLIFTVLMVFSAELYSFLSQPLVEALPEGSSMVATGVISPFLTPFKLAIYSAFILAMPYILHQLWAFVSPGLYQNERRIALPLLISSVVLFYCGIAFAWFVVFPLLFNFMASIQLAGVTYLPDINDNLNIMLKLFFAFGLAFEIPVATVLLILSGVTTAEKLVEARPYVIVGCFVVGMLLTPPDVISQTLLAVPMWMLFEVGVLASRWFKPSPTVEDEAS